MRSNKSSRSHQETPDNALKTILKDPSGRTLTRDLELQKSPNSESQTKKVGFSEENLSKQSVSVRSKPQFSSASNVPLQEKSVSSTTHAGSLVDTQGRELIISSPSARDPLDAVNRKISVSGGKKLDDYFYELLCRKIFEQNSPILTATDLAGAFSQIYTEIYPKEPFSISPMPDNNLYHN
jgi:hypothetical protein